MGDQAGGQTYKVIIDGGTLPGFEIDDVRSRLAGLMKVKAEDARRLIGGKPSTVKSGVDQPTGMRYVNALSQIGVACKLEPEEILAFDLDTQTATAQPRQKTPDEKYCTECGAIIRAKAEICPKCGIRQNSQSEQASRVDVTHAKYEGFYRSNDDKMLAGVCAGLAHKWNISRLGVRVVTFLAAFFLWIPLIIYLICWIVFPPRPTKATIGVA